MINSREIQIAERRSQIPRKYKRIYGKAVEGKSLRACINAQCLECVMWVSKEVTLCTDLACPLYAVRPYRNSANARKEDLSGAESEKSAEGSIG